MSKFYFGLVNDLKRSLFIVASSQVKIPVFFTLNVDFVLLDTGKVRSIEIRRYGKDWERRILDFLRSALTNDQFERFDFKFSIVDAYMQGHKVSVKIDTKLAAARILENNDKKKEENKIKHNQTAIKELQQAYLSQDVDSNSFEDGSKLPSIED